MATTMTSTGRVFTTGALKAQICRVCGAWNPAERASCRSCGLGFTAKPSEPPAAKPEPKKRSRYNPDLLRQLDSAMAKTRRK